MSEVSASLERNPYAKTAWVTVRNTHSENRLQVVLELDGVEDVLEDTWVPCLDISESVHLYSHQITNLFNGRDEEISSLKAQLKEAKEHREWLSDRLIHKYGENENCDYHIKARETVKARGVVSAVMR